MANNLLSDKMLSSLSKRLLSTPVSRLQALSKTRFPIQPLSRSFFHIPDMRTEQTKKIHQDEVDAQNPLVKTDRVYAPTYTIEFNRVGEILLYSREPIEHMTIYFKYPYILYESAIPLTMFLWYVNPFMLPWHINQLNIIAMSTPWWPRVWYLAGFKYRPRRMWLLRGGRYVKIESSSLANDRFTVWAETQYFNVLTQDG